VGIKLEFLPYVFDRFRQAGSTRDGGVNRGLGLGMSIAHDIVERHGRTITADSAGEGKGATFTVRLPLRNTSERVVVPSHLSAARITPGVHSLEYAVSGFSRTDARSPITTSSLRINLGGVQGLRASRA
jgi:hypothetical protein